MHRIDAFPYNGPGTSNGANVGWPLSHIACIRMSSGCFTGKRGKKDADISSLETSGRPDS